MPRLFTAIEVPADVAFSLSMMRGGLPGARWVEPENYHITLRFIGDVDRRTGSEVASALMQRRRDKFSVRIAGLDAFGGNKPHAIFASVERSAALLELQAEQERILRRIGLKAESRKFSPHVTLARLRGAKPADVARYLALRGNFFLPPFPVERIVLFSSRDSVGGGPYLVEESFPLAAVAPPSGDESGGKEHDRTTRRSGGRARA